MAQHNPKFMVLSIDGVPFDLVRRMIGDGVMPNLGNLAQQGTMQIMRSVQPTVSCVAWATYATGKNPGKHGIYGFIDRRPDTYDLAFPNGSTMTGDNIWEILSKAGKRVFAMNIPSTYPPRPVNGIMIGGFLTPTLDKAAYPSSVNAYLKSIDYRIDSDAMLARQDKKAMLADLDKTLDTRAEAMFHFMDQEDWDFFHTHIMGTDRINHFIWEKMESNDSFFAPAFFDYYRRIDAVIGKLLDRLPADTPIMIFSDHGFCTIKYEVQLSRYLVEKGWTTPSDKPVHPLSINPTKSKAYCLIPGRIFVNLRGREPAGIVPLQDYQQTREELAADLMELRDPDTDEQVIRKVVMREDIYWPNNHEAKPAPQDVAQASNPFGQAADLIAIPYDGYDLKLGLGGNKVFTKTELEGMHTYHDATMISRGIDLPTENLEIIMLARPILQGLGVEAPADMDGEESTLTKLEL